MSASKMLSTFRDGVVILFLLSIAASQFHPLAATETGAGWMRDIAFLSGFLGFGLAVGYSVCWGITIHTGRVR